MRKYLFVLFLGAVMVACLPAELDNLQSFEYRFDELEEVDPLPEVEFPEPPEVPQEPGGVEVTESTDQLVRDVVQAVIDEDIDQINLTIIEQFAQVAENEVPTEVLVAEVTNDWIAGIFDGSVTPSPELQFINDEFENIEDFLPYFSQLKFPNVDGIEIRGRLIIDGIPLDPPKINLPSSNLEITSLVTPCKEAAEELYLANIQELTDQAAVQRAEAEAFYADLITFFETEYVNELNAQGDLLYEQYATDFEEFAIVFNNAIDDLSYPETIIRGLKVYLAAYVIQSYENLNEWFSSYLLSIDVAKEGNIDRLKTELNLVLDEIDQNLAAGIAEQTTLYNEAVNNCHDQGFGG
ncbi:hypothetical protein [uncultured Algoriphagus sp.]|uniref:hypothetical protein n=1 Tax=uncultured Algoriphagus sp. TaxID=417365 RepID=UPI0025941BA7|nr:hypothetical protein [uncultured Algoriphagus sp.]